MPIRRRKTSARALRCALAACAAFAAVPAAADAATLTLRPDGTVLAGWTVSPLGTPHWDVLNDAVTAPTAPSTATDFISSTNSNTQLAEMTLTSAAIPSGENVTGATAWTYLQTGSARTIIVWVTSGSTTLGTVTIPAGSAAGWYQLPMPGALTQSQVDALEIGLTHGGGSGSLNAVYATYMQVDTVDPTPPPPPPPPPPDDPPVDPPVDPPADPPVDPPADPAPTTSPTDPVTTPSPTDPGTTTVPTDPPVDPEQPPVAPPVDPETDVVKPALAIAGTNPTATPAGDVPVTVGCGADMTDGCAGVLWLEEPLAVSSSSQISAARRSARRFSRNKRYKLKPGQRKTVPVRLDRRTHRKFKKKRSFKVAVVAQQKDAGGRVVTLRRTVRVFNTKKKKR